MTCRLNDRSGSLVRIVFLCLSFTYQIASVAAQGNNSLQGRVLTPEGIQPTTSVRVKLTLNGRPIQETLTDLSGRFHFTGLGRGTYQLTAEGDGKNFRPQASTLTS
jgi:hypothetical protein